MTADELHLLLSNFDITSPALRADMDETIERHRERERMERSAGDLLDAAILASVPGTREGWISLGIVDELLGEYDIYFMADHLKSLLVARGYVEHPFLKNGRTDNPVKPDGKRAKLMLTAGHFSLNHTKPSMIARAYEIAQGTAT